MRYHIAISPPVTLIYSYCSSSHVSGRKMKEILSSYLQGFFLLFYFFPVVFLQVGTPGPHFFSLEQVRRTGRTDPHHHAACGRVFAGSWSALFKSKLWRSKKKLKNCRENYGSTESASSVDYRTAGRPPHGTVGCGSRSPVALAAAAAVRSGTAGGRRDS